MAITTTNRRVLQIAGGALSVIEGFKGTSEALNPRELVIATDKNQLILGCAGGEHVVLANIGSGDTAARTSATPTLKTLFWDTTEEALYVGDGSAWKVAVAADLSGLMPKVTSAVENNIATFANDGTVKDSGLKLDDSGFGTTDLWSADKVTKYVTDSVSGMAWQEPVKKVILAPDASAADGDRFLVFDSTGAGGAATGAFAGKEGKIAVKTASGYDFIEPVDGMALYSEEGDNDDVPTQYTFNGTKWINISSGFAYTAGNGIDISSKAISVAAKANGGLTVDTAGVSVVVDDETIHVDSSTGELYIDNLDFGEFDASGAVS